MKTILVIPENWNNISKQQEQRLNLIRPFSLHNHSLSNTKKKNHKTYNTHTISEHAISLWVLPKKMATGKHVKFWPRICDNNRNDKMIQAICFADTIDELFIFLEASSANNKKTQKTYVTCQYEYPYTAMLEKWSKAGAKAIHPGDYFKDDFLQELSTFKGNWVYFGHALEDRLRGYEHLLHNELCSNKPANPLMASLWFTCSTLSSKGQNNVALNWYLSGATQCLIASPNEIKTGNNQKLGKAWLEVAINKKQLSIADILIKLASDNSLCKNTLSKYCLLGNPWVAGNL